MGRFRWVTVAAPGASTSVALIARPDTGAETGNPVPGFRRRNEYTAMWQRGIEVGGAASVAGVPPMFMFEDPDGSKFEILESSA